MIRAPFRRLLRDTRGATALEYALIAALVGLAAVTAYANLGDTISTQYSEVNSSVSDAVN
ncbi:Flp family type IVb pilin [Alteraurantiacibacter buctensis]|uniref:Flp family type IVb pilin n=1 Tax=Alteraurantiacibacter buctensis TaxID=1503981 RepID=A0A844YWZ4_9SPHN|nr:Flp family type IVb pilin [Alteraurantiacibacter buctensis]MXO71566.1 Flp family type IVb pilin [Alteraurantiacibacter buctensis]